MVLFIVILLLLLVLVTEVMQPNEVLGGEHGTCKKCQKIKGPDKPHKSNSSNNHKKWLKQQGESRKDKGDGRGRGSIT